MFGCSGDSPPAESEKQAGPLPGPASPPPPSAEELAALKVARSFLDGWQQADFDAAKSSLTVKAAANFARDTVFWFGAGASYDLKRAEIRGDEARVNFDLVSVVTNGEQGGGFLRLRQENGGWRVADLVLGGADEGANPLVAGITMPMKFESTPFRMPYQNRSPDGEIDWQPTGDAFPPVDSSRKGPAAWTTDIAQLTFPDSPAAGHLWGQAFEPDTATLEEGGLGVWELTLQVGDDFDPEQQLALLLHLGEDDVPAGERCQVAGRRDVGNGRAQASMHAKKDESDAPGTKIFHNVTLNLQFGAADGNQLPGRLYLCLPDADKSFVAGTFVASIEREESAEPEQDPALAKPKPLKPITEISPTDKQAVREALLSRQRTKTSFTTQSIDALTAHGAAAAPVLTELLADENKFVRKQAAHSLGDLGPYAAEAVPALIAALDDSEEFVQGQAAEALAAIGPAASSAGPALVTLVRKGRMFSFEEALDALEKTGAETDGLEAVLIKVLEQGGAFTIEEAVAGLKRFGFDTKPAVPLLIERLQRGNMIDKPHAAAALGQIGPDAEAAGPLLLEMLESGEDDDERVAAAEALGKIGYDVSAAVPSLIDELQQTEGLDRDAVIKALGKLGPAAAPAVPLLIEISKSDPRGWPVDKSAVEALGDIGPAAKPAISALEELAASEDSLFKDEKATEALGKIGEAALPSLIRLLDERREIAGKAAEALGKMGSAAEPAVPALLILARSGKSFVEDDAVEALGQIGPPALPALIELLQSSDSINVEAAEALGQMGAAAEPALPALEQSRAEAGSRLKSAIDEAVAAIQAGLEKRAAAKSGSGKESQTTAPSAVREWTSRGGQTVEAELIEVKEGEVLLKRTDTGQTIAVPIDQLSEADQAYVADQEQ